MARYAASLFRTIADAVFPGRCLLCRRKIGPSGAALCPACQERLRRQIEACRPVCPSCGRIQAQLSDGLCVDCRTTVEPFVSSVCLGHYVEPFTTLVRHLKFGSKPMLARDLGILLDRCLPGFSQDVLITWVPLSRRRWLGRGYNQAERLARVLSRARGLPCQRLLVRSRHTRPQARLPASRRRLNAEAAFALVKGQMVSGRCVILVDDVLTTGATTGQCARILAASGASAVHIVTLACG